MRILLSCFLYCFLVSCDGSNNSTSGKGDCYIRLDSLVASLDSAKVELFTRPGTDSVFVYDRSIESGEGSAFAFDSRGRLGSFSFIHEWPYSNFTIQFDSLGRKKRLRNNEVVQWRFLFPADSSVEVTALLATIDRNYGDLKVQAGSFIDSAVAIYNSSFSKVVCLKAKFASASLGPGRKLYLAGRSGEKCGGRTANFIDSVIVPRSEASVRDGLRR